MWEHTGPAVDCGDEVADLLSEHLARKCRLVGLDDQHTRPTELGGGEVGFSDGYPLLIATEASLADLNARLPSPLPMDRFRPNLVVAGSAAFDEDEWLRLEVAEIVMDVVKPCARCAITRVDQATGVRGDGEPLRTLWHFSEGQRRGDVRAERGPPGARRTSGGRRDQGCRTAIVNGWVDPHGVVWMRCSSRTRRISIAVARSGPPTAEPAARYRIRVRQGRTWR